MTEGEVEAMESLLPVDLILLGQCLLSLFFCLLLALLCSRVLIIFLLFFVFFCKELRSCRCFNRCPSLETKWQSVGSGKKGATKVFKHGQKIPIGLKIT